jgi:GDPmannose 4,6-dehydratase
MSGQVMIEIDEKLYRPAEVNTLLGDSTRARSVLGWQPKHDIESLIRDMVAHDRAGAGI